jgi:hypothetical protein
VRKFFLIVLVNLIIPLKCFSQAEVTIDCDDQWGAGRYNKVQVSVTFRTEGFARITEDFPVGFDVAGSVTPGCDLSWSGTQLNVVFMDVRPGKSAVFSYYIKPESNMYGPFNMQGEIVIISDGTDRYSVKLPEKTIDIGGRNGLLPEEMKNKQIQKTQQIEVIPVKMKLPVVARPSGGTVFRVQVSASSRAIPEARLRKDMGLEKGIKITVIKSVNSYKYQAGEYTDYNEAAKLLKRLKEKGVKGAFIVTYPK